MTTVLASGASARYGWWLLNLVGSVQANSDVFDRIVLFDLGLDRLQRRLARSIRGAELRTVPAFAPRWREGRAWKTWIWTHVEADRLLWLDAGVTVLRPLEPVLAQIDARGYFVVSQGHPLEASVPSDYYDLFSLPRERGERTQVAAGIIGFDTGGDFYRRVIVPTYDAALRGLSRGFSAGELERLNTGLDRTDEPVVRDCRIFRHEQTLLNIHLYREFDDPMVADLDEFAGWRSAHDHPRQVVWSHRRRGDLAYLPRVRYRRPLTPLGTGLGWWRRLDWWRVNHSWLFRPATYARKTVRLLRLER